MGSTPAGRSVSQPPGMCVHGNRKICWTPTLSELLSEHSQMPFFLNFQTFFFFRCRKQQEGRQVTFTRKMVNILLIGYPERSGWDKIYKMTRQRSIFWSADPSAFPRDWLRAYHLGGFSAWRVTVSFYTVSLSSPAFLQMTIWSFRKLSPLPFLFFSFLLFSFCSLGLNPTRFL